MALAWLLTALALGGVFAGIALHRGQRLSRFLALAGGLLLFFIALFWLLPEIAEVCGRLRAFALVAAAAVLLALVDHVLTRFGHSPRHGVVAPLLAATAIHSLLDGWSIRALAGHPLLLAIVPAGLALHKIPEGLALGWILRRSGLSSARAATFGSVAELFTLLGAFLQPVIDRSGHARFGPSWTASVLTIIAGAFLFLGIHALLPYFKRDH